MAECGILFDLDGTLADTLQDIANAVNAALRGAGLDACDWNCYREWVGRGWKNLITQAVGPGGEEKAAEVAQEAFAHYRRHLTDCTRLYEGIQEVLAALSRRGVVLAVLSNKPHELTVSTLEALGCARYFVAVQGAVDEALRKPDPTLALQLAGRMGLAPGRIYLVGDSGVDMETAERAGMMSVGVTWGFRDRRELVEAGAAYIVDRPEELLRLPGVPDEQEGQC